MKKAHMELTPMKKTIGRILFNRDSPLGLMLAAGLALAAHPAFADGPTAADFKFKLAAVAVAKAKTGEITAEKTSPESRVVVKSGKHEAAFFVEYEFPANVSARFWLDANCTSFSSGGNFGSSGSGVHSGKGESRRVLHLDDECHDKHVHLKSVRICVAVVDDKGKEGPALYVCDMPVDVVFASGKIKEGDAFEELEPLPPPPAVTTTLLPGWTEDFKAAKAQAKKEGKLVLGYFLNSRHMDEKYLTAVREYLGKQGKKLPESEMSLVKKGVLDHKVLGSRDFVERAGKSFVLYMCELDDTKQSWAAQGNVNTAFKCANRHNCVLAPEMAIVDSDGRRMALLDQGGWEGGVDGFMAKIEKARKDGEAAMAEERRKREEAEKKLPPKTDGTSTPRGFTDNLDEALAKAKAEGKLVYACFSGSDWCGWCQRLEEEVFSDPLFAASVMDDYVLVFIDSPSDKGLLSDHAKAANPQLVKKYGIRGYPSALILDGDGNKLGKTGYREGGAAKYVEHLKELKASQKGQ